MSVDKLAFTPAHLAVLVDGFRAAALRIGTLRPRLALDIVGLLLDVYQPKAPPELLDPKLVGFLAELVGQNPLGDVIANRAFALMYKLPPLCAPNDPVMA